MKFLFVLPGSPAPIGGFKLLYEHGRMLQESGFEVRFLHVNGGLLRYAAKDNSLIIVAGRYLKFIWTNTFGRWKNYAYGTFGLISAWQQKLLQKNIDQADVLCLASWQLFAEVYDTFDVKHVKVIHPVMDYPGYMGPADEIYRSWTKDVAYFCISDYLYRAVRAHSNSTQIVNIGCVLPGGREELLVSSVNFSSIHNAGILLTFSTGKYKNSGGTSNLIIALRNRFPNEPITVFGRPNRPAQLPADVNYLKNLSDHEVAGLYRSSSVFVFFSDFEGFGLMPLEAMRFGCPVVCTDCYGNRDYIAHNVNALVVAPGNIKAAVESVDTLLKDEILREKIGKAGLERSLEYLPEQFNGVIVGAYINV